MAKAWKEQVVIPTYEAGTPEKNPIFLEKRVYQGSSGVVYPYPVIEKIADEKTDHTYNAVFLENEYIKVMILPELGGRVQMAYDKIKQRHFVYYNHVVKPALVGLAGPWISGGIEFNWPQHHRPSTFMPVDTTIEEHADGSVTVWVNEMERMFHQKGMAGFTLRPGCAYLEIKGVLYNRTDLPQTFLWWANPAVAVNDHYQSVFPPDVNAVFDHGKRAVSSFPIATGTYYKMDYSAGVDISNYKNIKVPTSYMGVNSRYDFEGGYENDTQAGMLHVASHHVSPGKKQWTWGNGDFGRAWDRNLTDEDGPYIELMAGVYTENQPDFTWLMPYEEKSFTQYFLPYRELGIVKNASKDFLMNIDLTADGKITLKIFATSRKQAKIMLAGTDGTVLLSETVEASPEAVIERTVEAGGHTLADLKLTIAADGRTVLTWEAEPDEIRPIPDAAEAALEPQQIKTVEQLYLTGLHLEQYRHATYNPVEYYEEGLRRDPDDVRCNNALGLWYIRKGRFDRAERYLAKAVRILQKRNPNPYDGEPIFNLGVALRYQGRFDEAYARFYKSTWNGAWQEAGYFECARISLMQGRLDDALYEIDRCLIRNTHNHKARALRATILRHMGRGAEALPFIEESLSIDPFNYGALYEKYLIAVDSETLNTLISLMRGECHNYDETALDYVAAGCHDEAAALWALAEKEGAVSPMTYYYLGWSRLVAGDKANAKAAFEKAAATPADCCFPNRPEAILALRAAMEVNESDALAPLMLGNLYYDKRQYDLAVEAWERSSSLNPGSPMVWRNLALAYFNKLDRHDQALELMKRAFLLDTTDSRIFMELIQLLKRMEADAEGRLELMKRHADLVGMRDDLVLEKATAQNLTGAYADALETIDNRIFHPWEGGEGKVSGQYQFARVELAKQSLAKGDYAEAIRLLEECLAYPHNLGEGKLEGAQDNDFHFLLGEAYAGAGDAENARSHYEAATLGPVEPAPALYYNDAKPDKIFYQGMALLRLGRTDEARGRFHRLVNFGEKHIFDDTKMDYFAVSLPDLLIWEEDLNVLNRIHCNYMMALGHYGLGDKTHCRRYIDRTLELAPEHAGIRAFKSFIDLESGK